MKNKLIILKIILISIIYADPCDDGGDNASCDISHTILYPQYLALIRGGKCCKF